MHFHMRYRPLCKALAKADEGLSHEHIQLLVDQNEFVEICNEQKIQK